MKTNSRLWKSLISEYADPVKRRSQMSEDEIKQELWDCLCSAPDILVNLLDTLEKDVRNGDYWPGDWKEFVNNVMEAIDLQNMGGFDDDERFITIDADYFRENS